MRLAVLLAVVLGLVAGPAAAVSAPGDVLVLGDSYASGEGLPSASGECGTETTRSWGALVAAELGSADLQLVACSGAEVADVTVGGPLGRPAQLDVAAPADLVLLTLGGNDLGFVEIVGDCLGFAGLTESPGAGVDSGDGWTALLDGDVDRGCDVTPDELLARVASLRAADRFVLDEQGTTGSLADVYAAVAARVVAPGGQLVVVGYPALFSDVAAWPERYVQRCHGLRAGDADALGDVVVALDEAIAASVEEANAILGAPVVTHVDLQAAVAGGDDGEDHRLCGGGTPWINGLTVVEGGVDVAQLLAQLGAGPGGIDLDAVGARPGGSFHPSTAGHRGIAATVLEALG